MGDAREVFLNYFQDKTDGNPSKGFSVALSGNIEKDMDELGLNMSSEAIAFMGVAYVAADFANGAIPKSFNDHDEIVISAVWPRDFQPEKDENSEIRRGDDRKEGFSPTYLPGRKTSDECGDYNNQNIDKCPTPEAVGLHKRIVGGKDDWKAFYIDLLGAHQTKDLTAGHVKSYFAWKGDSTVEGNIFVKYFPALTAGAPQIVADNSTRGLMTQGKWTTYRTTFATTTNLFMKMLSECPQEFLTVFDRTTVAAIKSSSSNPWSERHYRAISEKAQGVLYAYLQVTGELPENLWGPKKEYDKLSFSEKESLKNWFTKAKDSIKTYKGTAFEGAKDMPTSVMGITSTPAT